MTRQAWLISAGVALLVVVAWFFLLYQPKQDEVAELDEEREQVLDQQQQVQARIDRLEGVRERAPEIEAALSASNAVIPTDPGLPAALRQLQQAADDSGVQLATISPGRPSSLGEGGLAEISLNVQLNGGYFQIVDFLRRIEDPTITPRGVLWTDLGLGVADYPTLSASLSGQMFARLGTTDGGGGGNGGDGDGGNGNGGDGDDADGEGSA